MIRVDFLARRTIYTRVCPFLALRPMRSDHARASSPLVGKLAKPSPSQWFSLYVGIVSRGKQGEWREEKHSEKRIRVIDRLQERVAPQTFVNCVFDGMNLLFVPYVLALPGGNSGRVRALRSLSSVSLPWIPSIPSTWAAAPRRLQMRSIGSPSPGPHIRVSRQRT